MRSGTSLRNAPGARNTGVSGCSTRSYIERRIWRPISSTSLNPTVVRSPIRAPFRSSTALVAIVVPWTKRAIASGVTPHSRCISRNAFDRAGARVAGCCQDLHQPHLAGRIDADEVGERAADIDADRQRAGRLAHALAHAALGQDRQDAATMQPSTRMTSTLLPHQALAAAIASISISHSGLTRALTMIVAEPGRASPKYFARAAPAAATSSGRTR